MYCCLKDCSYVIVEYILVHHIYNSTYLTTYIDIPPLYLSVIMNLSVIIVYDQ